MAGIEVPWFPYLDRLLEHDLKIICSFISFLRMCMSSIQYLRGISAMRKWLKGFKFSWVPSMWQYSLEGTHASRCAELYAWVQYRTLLFCQRPAYLMSRTLCAYLLEEPDTGLVLENWTSSICPEAALRWRSVGELTVSTPPLSSFRSTFLCLLHKGSQATESVHEDKPHRALLQAAGSLCRNAILFPLQQMSAARPLPSSSRLCAFFHFSLEIPPVQDVFYFTFEKAEPLHRAWVTSSRSTSVVQPQIFALGSLNVAQGRWTLFWVSLQLQVLLLAV